MTIGETAKRVVRSALGAGGYEVRRVESAPDDDPAVDYVTRARAIDARHAAQTLADVDALRQRYREPVFGTVRVWELVERLAQCVDPSDCALFCTSQQTHLLQMLEGMARDGVDDPHILLAVMIHDLGKVLLIAGEDPANVVGMNSPIGEYDDGVGLDQCTFQWNHDEFGYSRFRDHVPDAVSWLVRHHSMDAVAVAPLMDARDRDYTARYFDVFTRYDHGTKTPFHLPTLRIEEYRNLVEGAFPEPIPF